MTEKPKPETPPAKKRTESAETIALRAFRKRRLICQRMAAENDRHALRIGKLHGELEAHDQECAELPGAALELFERLVES